MCIGLASLKRMETKLYHVDHNLLDPLPFKIIYTNTVDLWWHRDSVIFKKYNIGVYDFKW